MPLDEFQQAARDAVCDWAVRCRHMPDRPTCERFIDPKDYDPRRAQDSIAAGRMSYDAHAAGRCLQATRENYCLTLPFSDEACAELFAPALGPGDACTLDLECEGECEIASCELQCCTGVCGPAPTGMPPPAPVKAAIGESCQTHTDCVDEAYCELDFVCTRRPEQEGQRCLFGCARGDLYCDVNELICKKYAARGEACTEDGGLAPPCDPAWSFCDGVCVDRPGVGEVCAEQPQTCVAGAFCNELSICQERGAQGAACTSSDQCQVVCNTAVGECVDYMTCTID